MAQGARAIVDRFLAEYGLSSLSNWAWSTYIKAGGGDGGMKTIELELPKQRAFQTRFPAYESLAAKGRAMTVNEMLAYERQAVQLLRAAGLPQGFYDEPQDVAKYIEADVSVVELQQRIGLAQEAVFSAPQETRDAIREFYGLGDGDLAAYFLDEQAALPVLRQRAQAAVVGGAARQQGVGIDRTLAEGLAAEGVNADTAREGFGQIAAQQGLYGATAGDQSTVDVAEQVGAQFGTDPASRRRVRRRAESRTAEFGGGSGYRAGQGGVSGLGSAT